MQIISKLAPALLFLSIASASVASAAPGWLSPDSFDMYSQAISGGFTDWHSPLLVAAWSLLGAEKFGPVIPFLIQNLVIWAGIFLVYRATYKRIGYWSLLIPISLIQFQFYWVSAWLWKDAFEAAALCAAMGLFAAALDEKNPKRALVLELLTYTFIASFTFARIYLFPACIFTGIAVFLIFRAKATPSFTTFRMTVALAAGTFLVITSLGFGVERVAIRPTSAGSASGTVLLDLARLECGQVSTKTKWIPEDYVIQGLGQICDNFSPVTWDPLMWPVDKKHTRLTLPPNSPNANLISTWLNGFLAHPSEYIVGRIKMLAGNLFSADWITPSVRISETEQLTTFGFGDQIGFPNFKGPNQIYAFLRFPYSLTIGSWTNQVFLSNALFVGLAPILLFVSVSASRLPRNIKKPAFLLICSVPLFALLIALTVPAVTVRYFSPISMLSFLIVAIVFNLIIDSVRKKA